MMNRKSLAAALVLTTILAGASYATEQGAKPTAAQTAVDRDVGQLSKDGAEGFRDIQSTRLAIFEANPARAKEMIGKAQAAFAKAKTDYAVFKKAEADLKTRDNLKDHTAKPAKSDGKAPVAQTAWIPVDAQLTLADDFVATPEKASAVTEANKHLAKGEQKAALEKLKLADIEVNFIMAALPLDKTVADVDQAAALIGQGKYYEANALLKTTQDGMRFDIIDAVGAPQKSAANTASKTGSNAAGPAAGAKAN